MSQNDIFVGRKEELEQWLEVLAEPAGQAVVVTGPAGMGKTALVNRMGELAVAHSELNCGLLREQVTETDSVENTMMLLMGQAFEAASHTDGSFSGSEKRRQQWEAFFGVLPKGKEIRKLFSSLRYEPQRPAREQLIDRFELISSKLSKNTRAVFIIDPDKFMPEKSADAWRIVIDKLPSKIKIIIAQRPEDQLIINADFNRLSNLVRIPQYNLHKLEEEAVDEWVGLKAKDFSLPVKDLSEAIALYDGYPFSIDAAMKLVEQGMPTVELPKDPSGLAEELWNKVYERGEHAVCIFQALAILEVPSEMDVLLEVSGITKEQYKLVIRSDKYLQGLIREEVNGLCVYHQLLVEYICNDMNEANVKIYHQRAIDKYRYFLQAGPPYDSAAAVRLSEHELKANGKEAFVKSFLDECSEALIFLGHYKTHNELSRKALAMSKLDSYQQARLYGCLGLSYRKLGSLDVSIRMHDKAKSIFEKSNWLDGVASQKRHLGVTFCKKDELDRAEKMHLESLDDSERLGDFIGMARAYEGLGSVYMAQGKKGLAEENYIFALSLFKKLGNKNGMAVVYGNLALLALNNRNPDEAEKKLNKALSINKAIDNQEGIARDLSNLGHVYFIKEEFDLAEDMFKDSQAINKKIGNLDGIARNLGFLGLFCDDVDATYRRWGKARDIFNNIGLRYMADEIQSWIDSIEEDD